MREDAATIRALVSPADLVQAARVVRASFRTAAAQFGWNRENAPWHVA